MNFDPKNRAWVEIDSKAIENNSRLLKNFIGNDCSLMAIVKADGYGHGAVTVANAALAGGATSFGVATLEEGIELRKSGFNDFQILILGNLISSEELEAALQWNLTPTISDIKEAIICNNIAKNSKNKFCLHLKVDTGMTRLGCDLNLVKEYITKIDKLENVSLKGIYSHLSIADSNIKQNNYENFNEIQLKRFNKILNLIGKRKKSFCFHLANSAGTLANNSFHFDMVRVGLSLYGYYPTNELKCSLNLSPALKIKARITFIRDVDIGVGISYGHLFTTKRKSKLAVLAIGYADGVSRALSGKISASIDGVLVPQVGAITMDQMIIDITDKPDTKIGQICTILGQDGEVFISPESWCDITDSITWEILCGFKNRLPRIVI